MDYTNLAASIMFPSSRFSPEEAERLQLLLSKRVIRRDLLPDPITHVAGVDVAYREEYSIAAVVVLDYASMRLKETKTSRQKTEFPYRSTFLSFRELAPVVSAMKKLGTQPDVALVDGHGVAHPRRLGFASHLGLVLDAPTIGVAKSLLCGKIEDDGNELWRPVIHRGSSLYEASCETCIREHRPQGLFEDRYRHSPALRKQVQDS